MPVKEIGDPRLQALFGDPRDPSLLPVVRLPGRGLPPLLIAFAILFLAIVLFAGPALAVDLQVDPAHSSASFAVKHMMVSTVRGNFGKVSGKVSYDPKDPTRSTANIATVIRTMLRA